MLRVLVNDQRDAQFFTLFLTLYMFRAHRAHHLDVLETCRELEIKINTL